MLCPHALQKYGLIIAVGQLPPGRGRRRAGTIEAVSRDKTGKLTLSLRGRIEKLTVSRMYSHPFRAM